MSILHLMILLIVSSSCWAFEDQRISDNEVIRNFDHPLCGLAPLNSLASDEQTRIANPSGVAKEGQFPWHVHLEQYNNITGKYAICGGSIINERFILTAAHCLNLTHFGPLEVIAGALSPDNHTKILETDSGQIFPVTSSKCVKNSPDYDTCEGQMHCERYDFAVIKLKEPIRFSEKVRPICLAEKSVLLDDTIKRDKCYFSGTLHSNTAVIIDRTLHYAQFEPADECIFDTDVESQLGYVCVIQEKEGPRVEGGDSGGPGVCYNPHNGRWFQYGIDSRGDEEINRMTDVGVNRRSIFALMDELDQEDCD